MMVVASGRGRASAPRLRALRREVGGGALGGTGRSAAGPRALAVAGVSPGRPAAAWGWGRQPGWNLELECGPGPGLRAGPVRGGRGLVLRVGARGRRGAGPAEGRVAEAGRSGRPGAGGRAGGGQEVGGRPGLGAAARSRRGGAAWPSARAGPGSAGGARWSQAESRGRSRGPGSRGWVAAWGAADSDGRGGTWARSNR